jgi:two-component system NarL family sensor kinase
MNKILILFYACILSKGLSANAQPNQKEIALFERRLKASKEDTNKVLLYLRLARIICSDSITLSADFTNKAHALAEKLKYPHGVAMSTFQRGIYKENKKDYYLAIRYYRDAARIAELHHLHADIYKIYSASLNMYYYMADYTDAMDIAQKGLALAEQMNDKEDEAHYYNQLGFIYLKQEKADESIKYYKQYLLLGGSLDNKLMIAGACDGIAEGYLLKADYQAAVFYLFKALDIYYKMQTSEKLDKTRLVFKTGSLVNTLFNLSRAYKRESHYKEALYYSQTIFKQYIKGGEHFNRYDLARYYINAGDIYCALHDYRNASYALNKGLCLARSILHRDDIRDAYNGLSKNFAAQKRYDSAYYYHLLFTGLKDSIINEKVSKEINKLEVERRDKEITVLNQQRKLAETEIARQSLRWNFIIGAVALITVISFLLLHIKNRIKQQKLIFEKKLAVQLERQRISGDMHDDIGTGLSTMLIYVNMLKIKLEGSDEAPNIKRISVLGDELVGHMKEIVWSLSPGNDRLDNLLFYIRQYFVLLFEPLAYDTNIVFPAEIPDLELKNEVRRNIFLCIKETLNNTIKHAGATCVELEVYVEDNKLIIQAKDNGCGFAIIQGGHLSGNGLNNIDRRMKTINGDFRFFNNNGAVVQLEISLLYYPIG